ncbi:hypothetical protein BC828DRAFT_396680 [Blastocladiella britannica]|nr:hypothetical protein BC828DRAFT_396680 [Blastocladiella britannica]
MILFSALFVVALVIGFVVCMQIFSATLDVLTVQFATARTVRRYVTLMLENVRLLVFNNMDNDFNAYQTALKSVTDYIKILTDTLLPVLAQSWNYLQIAPPVFRVFKVVFGNHTLDYVPLYYDALQMSNAVVQAGQTALLYPGFGELVPDLISRTPDIRFLLDNRAYLYFYIVDSIFEAVRTLPRTGIDAYNQTVSFNMIIMLTALAGSIMFLFATFTFTHKWMLTKYFVSEQYILKLVASVPKKTAASLVLTLDEEIESFKEIVDVDSDAFGSLDQKIVTSNADGGQGAPTTRHRSRKYAMQLMIGFSVVAMIVVGMFAQTLMSLDLSHSFTRMVNNDDRRLFINMMRVFSNEWISADTSLANDKCSRGMRGALDDAMRYNDLLLSDPGGLSTQFPALTVQTRDCVGNPNTCPGVTDRSDIGFSLKVH